MTEEETKQKAKHTPGPWGFDGMECINADSGPVVADVHPYDSTGLPIGGSVYEDENHSQEEAEANAYLIAAAPDLLDRVMGRMDRCPCHHESFGPENPSHEGRGGGGCADCEADRTALKKAQGE